MPELHIHYSNTSNTPFEQVLIRNFSHEVQLRQEFVFFFLLEGSMQINLYERTLSLHEHDIFFLMPGEVHSIVETSPDIHVLAIFIYKDYLQFLCPDIENIRFETHHIHFSRTSEIYSQVCSDLAGIIMNTLKRESTTQLKLISAISSILITLLDAYGSKQLDTQSHAPYIQQQMTSILEYLNNNYAEKITLASAADVLGFHPQYFSTFFKKQFHVTFVEYLTWLRVNRTLPLLTTTNISITELALNHGFSSHKTYSAAFRKIHGISPSDYRRDHVLSSQNALLEGQSQDYFSFFQSYWQSDNPPGERTRVMQNHVTLRLPVPKRGMGDEFCHEHLFAIGRASDILRNDIQEQIREAHRELHIDALRMRDIFSDDLYVYYEDEEKNFVINWKYIDIIFDFLLNLGIKPFPELGFMPRDLASKRQYANWLYRPNVSSPKSYKKWSALITDFMQHLIARYGREEVISWRFDFWATSNLDFRDSYWNESREEFFLFYRITYFSIKNVDPDIRIGSPDFSLPAGLDWYDAFFDYCKEYEMRPSYLSLHLYNCEDDVSAKSFTRFSESWDRLDVVNTTKDTAVRNLHVFHELLKKKHLDDPDIVISNWNLSYFPRDLVRDTCFMTPYILYTFIQVQKIAPTMCYHSLSDINEDFLVDKMPFHGGPGLMDFNGFKKASYYAFYLLDKLGTELLETGENYIMTRSETGIQLLLFHYVYYDFLYEIDDRSGLSYKQRYNIYESSEELVIHSILPLPEGSYRIKTTQVNRQNGSAYDLWAEMGAPEELTAEMISYLKQKNCPEITYRTVNCNGNLLLDTALQPHGAVLLEITKE